MKKTPTIVATIVALFPWLFFYFICKGFGWFEIIASLALSVGLFVLVYFAVNDMEKIDKIREEAEEQKEENLKIIRDCLSKETKEELLERVMRIANTITPVQLKNIVESHKKNG